ncbi:hypothetical protein JKP88DRAFT_271804 [Tribonema minus]|uniref:MOSC domain-containing protein n=1 Tax=Tribonema minus TaxID=303371 RepID=A0A835Z5C1_9STRA|nr:hypothetical protein JKP88DRAFT_271804 [Tribonema minus]
MSFESLSHLLGGEDPDLTLVVTGVVLSISVVALCWLFPCLPDSRSSKKDEPYYGTEAAEVTSLRVYPIKSCAGHEVDCWELTKTGLKYDRNWVVVGADGRFRSQRRLPKMAVITPSLPTSDTDPLIIKAPGMPELVVPARRRGDPGAKEVPVGVWGDQCTGIDQGEETATWLSRCLGEPGLRLLRYDDAFTRGTDPAYGRGFFTAYSDGFPLLLASEESLEDLNARLAQPIGMERFRPNVVVEGMGAWAEDAWTKVAVGDVVMRVVKPCDRCQVPTIDQSTGTKTGAEPTATLRAFRTGAHLGMADEKVASAVFFGQNVLHEGGRGALRVGDRVEVLRVRVRQPPPPKAAAAAAKQE